MSNVLILHGIYGHPAENWLPWLKEKLEEKGIDVNIPNLPTHEPLLPEHWWDALGNDEEKISNETIIVAHSLGVAFALKIIERHPVKAAYFVAPAWGKTGNKFDPIMSAVADQHFDWSTIKKNCSHFVIFHSDNDPYLKLERAETLAKNLDAEMIVIPHAGHFNEAAGYMQFDELLDKITGKTACDVVREIVHSVGSIKVRAAKEKDAPRIAEIHVETWQHAYRGQVPDAFLDNLPSTLGDRTKKWQETLQKKQRGMRVFVAEMGKQIVGFCIVNPCRDEDMDNKTVGELGAIYIDARYMNRGVGSALQKEGLSFLKTEGFEKATLWVLDTNEKARTWYESKDWKVEGKTKVDDRGDVQLHEIRYVITL